jgi:C4-dicarboxylate transporter DctQ subunit
MLQTCLPVLHGQAPSLGDIMNNNAIYNRIEEIIIIVLFILMTIITAMTVVTRFFFNFTLSWAEQFARLLLVWISFAGISWAGSINAHMRVTAASLLIRKKPARFEILLIIGDVVTVIYSFYLSYRIFLFMMMVMRQGQIMSAITWLPKWIMYLAGVLGMFGLGVRVLQRRYYWIKEKLTKGATK